MTNKPMLSVERDLIERASRQLLDWECADDGEEVRRTFVELRALLDKEVDGNSHAPKQQGEPVAHLSLCLKGPNRGDYIVVTALGASGNDVWSPDIAVYAEQPAPVADQAQCEECKGWGYHENHHEGGGTECGECGGSGNAPVEQFSGDTVVCRRYQLEQSPGQNFYHYDIEPVYGSVPVTVSELITLAESAPPAVVMPEPYGLAMFKMLSGFDSVTPEQFNLVWTACRKEVARLNGVKT